MLAGGGFARAGQGGDGPHGCINPAGHERGWCKHGSAANPGNEAAISGTVIAVNGDLAQFRESNGTTVTVNQSALLRDRMALNVGAYYTLRGYWSNNMFVAQPAAANGYPYPYSNNGGENATVQGVITAVHGDRLTIMQGLFSSITIDDRQALGNGSAQNLYVGRSITAYGYWSGGTFYATSIS